MFIRNVNLSFDLAVLDRHVLTYMKAIGLTPGLQGKRFIVQGLGNVGYHAAKFLQDGGGVLVAVAEADGALHNDRGLDLEAIMAHRKAHGTLKGFPGATFLADSRAALVHMLYALWLAPVASASGRSKYRRCLPLFPCCASFRGAWPEPGTYLHRINNADKAASDRPVARPGIGICVARLSTLNRVRLFRKRAVALRFW